MEKDGRNVDCARSMEREGPVFDNCTALDARGRPMGLLLDGVRLNAPLEPEDGGPGASEQRRRASAEELLR